MLITMPMIKLNDKVKPFMFWYRHRCQCQCQFQCQCFIPMATSFQCHSFLVPAVKQWVTMWPKSRSGYSQRRKLRFIQRTRMYAPPMARRLQRTGLGAQLTRLMLARRACPLLQPTTTNTDPHPPLGRLGKGGGWVEGAGEASWSKDKLYSYAGHAL